MIINTTILFLRDLLPVFILFCYLRLFAQSSLLTSNKQTLFSLLLGVFGGLLFFIFAEYISDFFDGAGIEITKATLLFITYVCLSSYQITTVSHINNKVLKRYIFILFIIGITAFITLKSSEFLIFFNVYIQQSENNINMLIGCLIGIGICISFSVLFMFLLNELKLRRFLGFITICWYLFLAGQVSHSIDYLSQIDWLTIGTPLFNFNEYIRDRSEYGHILKALFGYEASPSTSFVLLYICSLTLPLIINGLVIINKKSSRQETRHE